MIKTLLVIGLILVAVGFIYSWFIPWRLVFQPFKISGLKEANPDSLTIEKGQRILAITAHIDDLEFFCGGTMARLQEQDTKIWLVIGTENYKWYYSTRRESEKNTEKRKHEQAKVSEYLGYEKIIYLGYPDYRLENNSESVEKVERIIEEFEPDAILTFDVVKGTSIQHRDHTAAGVIALKAAKRSPGAGKANTRIFVFYRQA